MDFNEKLKKYREENNLTQEDLANKLHVSRQAISKYETGRAYPSIDILQDIAKLLNMTVDELLSKNELAKETIEIKNRVNKNKYFLISLFVLVIIGISISIIAIVETKKTSNSPEVNENIEFCGIVGIASDEDKSKTFEINEFLNFNYFGFAKIYEGTMGFYKVMNINESVINQQEDLQSFDGTIYLSKKAKRLDFFSVYYDLLKEEYLYEHKSSTMVGEYLSKTILVENYNQKEYLYTFNYILFDELIEMKIIEYDQSLKIINDIIIGEENEYKIADNTLYVVVEEKLISQDGDYYYNRKIILNEEINKQYSYIVKKANDYLLASTYIKLTK